MLRLGRSHFAAAKPVGLTQALDLMKYIIVHVALSLALLGLAGRASAETPEEVETRYIDAIRTSGMKSAPDFIHPDELERFKAMLAPVLGDETAVAKNLRTGFFGPAATSESIRSMPAKDFMRAFMAIAEGQMKGMNITVGRSEILGSVKEGEVVHLVTRNSVGAGPLQLTQLEVVSLKPYQNTWGILLSGKLEGMAQAIKAQAGKSSP